jgi:hypothetical protein
VFTPFPHLSQSSPWPSEEHHRRLGKIQAKSRTILLLPTPQKLASIIWAVFSPPADLKHLSSIMRGIIIRAHAFDGASWNLAAPLIKLPNEIKEKIFQYLFSDFEVILCRKQHDSVTVATSNLVLGSALASNFRHACRRSGGVRIDFGTAGVRRIAR